MIESQAPQVQTGNQNFPENRRNEELIQLAIEILTPGATQPIDWAMVKKRVESVQEQKENKKDQWTANLRHKYAVTVEQRNAAKKATAGLRKALAALKPVADSRQLGLNKQDLKVLQDLQQRLQNIADIKIRHGSKFDPRKLFAVQNAVMLLREAGQSWSTTRHKEADKLAAALWGEPDTDFQEYLRAYLRLRPRRGQLDTASEPGTN